MLQKGSEQYKQAQKLANEIKDMAGTDRWNNNSYFDIDFESLGKFISQIQKIDGFAAKIAETVDKTMNPPPPTERKLHSSVTSNHGYWLLQPLKTI